MRTAFVGLVGLVVLGLAGSAQASTLVGDTVSAFFEAPNELPGLNLFNFTGSPESAVVGPGVEFSVALNAIFSADIAASSITLGITGIFGEIGDSLIYTFTDLDFDTGATIAGVSISSTDFSGVTFGFTADSITVNIPNQGLPLNFQSVVLDITPTSVVPEPATIGLSAFGALALVGLARSRRTR
ncbi:MAG: PEP-CTERM sorting domain-containing protein [Isosphaeraceae bacterium]|nr:PEP-CTERM sorting domain-containing protein [Isosphaeraceae bacterium]